MLDLYDIIDDNFIIHTMVNSMHTNLYDIENEQSVLHFIEDNDEAEIFKKIFSNLTDNEISLFFKMFSKFFFERLTSLIQSKQNRAYQINKETLKELFSNIDNGFYKLNDK